MYVCESCGAENDPAEGVEVRMFNAADDTYPLCGDCRPRPVTLTIENVYDDGYEETVVVETAIPFPVSYNGEPLDLTTAADLDLDDPDGEALGEWEQDHLFPHTGVGREGDATYTVTITAAADERLVGYVAEFGG